MSTAVVFGSTGAVGSQILTTLLTSTTCTSVTTISRRAPPAAAHHPQHHAIVEPDAGSWDKQVANLSPVPYAAYNAVGTTLGSAGGSIARQWAIDHDLCIANAQAAKAAGIKTYVYCSSAGTSGALSPFALTPYAQMKRGVEQAIRGLGFENAVILRPGMILGRERPKNKWLEDLFGQFKLFGQGFQDRWAQDQSVIGRAAVAAVEQIQKGKAPSEFWVLEQADIVRLGRDDWGS